VTPLYRPPSVGERARHEIRSEGIAGFAVHATRWLVQYAAGIPSSAFGTSRTFVYRGGSHEYLVHRHHYTWLNERAVEVPIARAAVAAAAADGRVLEVGNVLGHYGSVGHLVVDRYEQAPGVINADVLDFEDEAGFDLIVSVSTLEHVGWDERPRDAGAAERAFTHLKGLLTPGGRLVVTLPVGYNVHLDEAIRTGHFELSELRALRRDERHNRWREVDPADVWGAPYDSLLCTAHGIVVCHAEPGPATQHVPLDGEKGRSAPADPRPPQARRARPNSSTKDHAATAINGTSAS
jgi:SAM-dependent methyltransferase